MNAFNLTTLSSLPVCRGNHGQRAHCTAGDAGRQETRTARQLASVGAAFTQGARRLARAALSAESSDAGTPTPSRSHTTADMAAQIAPWERGTQEQSLREGMKRRLGSAFAPEGVEWWSKLMSSTPAATQIGFIAKISYVDITADLPHIACPTLVIPSEGSERASLAETRAWQESIPDSTLLVLPGDSDHVAASHADSCARATLKFISRTRSSEY